MFGATGVIIVAVLFLLFLRADTRPRWKVVADSYTDPVLGILIDHGTTYWYTIWIANDWYNTLSREVGRPLGTIHITEVKYAWFGLGKEL